MSIVDLLAILSFAGTIFTIGYQIGYHHGKHDDNIEQKK